MEIIEYKLIITFIRPNQEPRPARANHGPWDKLVNTPPPIPLDSHADGHTKVYFLIAINEGIASIHVTVPADERNKCVQHRY
jgi:hypothetical protein